ncbi:glycosyltransferase family 87 protein [Phenylobacterium sp.]|uniref:glycosyltransferase family 87 protein n=1 Tax=Phenylobacterium sp. TaxID=1871053 RepID=UPI0035AE0D58
MAKDISARLRPASWAALVIGLLAAAVGVWRVWRQLSGDAAWPENHDFGLYLKAAQALWQGQNPYAAGLYGLDPYAYPPLIADIVAALAKVFGAGALKVVWTALCGGALAASIALLLRGFGARLDWRWVILALGVALLGRTARSDLYHGQVNFFILLFLVSGLWLRDKGLWLAAALSWAVMADFKPFMGVVVLLSLGRREWKLAAATFVLSGLIFAASFLPAIAVLKETFLGWMASSRYYTAFDFSVQPNHQSLWSLFLRMFNENRYGGHWLDAAWLTPALIVPITALLVWLLAQALPRRAPTASAAEAGGLSLLEAGMVLAAWMCVAPTTEGDHILLVVPGLVGAAMLAKSRLADRTPSAPLWAAALASWALVTMKLALPFQSPTAFLTESSWALLKGPGVLLSGYDGFCLFAAVLFAALALRAERRSLPAAAGQSTTPAAIPADSAGAAKQTGERA